MSCTNAYITAIDLRIGRFWTATNSGYPNGFVQAGDEHSSNTAFDLF